MLKVLSCPICNESNLVLEDGVWRCKTCGAMLQEDKMAELEELLQKQEEMGEAIDLGNLRALLLQEMATEFPDRKALCSYCREILKVLPEDHKALFLLRFLQRKNNRRIYHNYLAKLAEETLTEHEKTFIYPHLIDAMDYDDKTQVIDFLEKQGEYEKYRLRVEDALAQRERENDLFANVPRDIFICHSHSDIGRLLPLISRMESEQGFTCWYSERNLPKDIDSYRRGIEQAIASCSVILVFASHACMLSRDVQWELDVAEKLGKKCRLEYRLEEVENSIKFKYFFDGLQWIDAANEEQGDLLMTRLYALIEEANHSQEREEEPKPQDHVHSDKPQSAEELIKEGDAAMGEIRYYDAMEKYLAAQSVQNSDELTRKMAICRDQIYSYESAFAHRYEEAKRYTPDDMDALLDEIDYAKRKHVKLSVSLRRCIAFENFLEELNKQRTFMAAKQAVASFVKGIISGKKKPAEPKPKPEPKPQPKPQPKPEPKPEPKPQPKPQPKPEPKPSDPASKATAKGAVKAENLGRLSSPSPDVEVTPAPAKPKYRYTKQQYISSRNARITWGVLLSALSVFLCILPALVEQPWVVVFPVLIYVFVLPPYWVLFFVWWLRFRRCGLQK